MNTFSITLIAGTSDNSCAIVAIPSRRASVGVEYLTGCPSTNISPSSATHDAPDDLAERRLARPVGAHEGVHGAGSDRDAHVVERLVAPNRLEMPTTETCAPTTAPVAPVDGSGITRHTAAAAAVPFGLPVRVGIEDLRRHDGDTRRGLSTLMSFTWWNG